ncbi:hypothetical protein NP493_7739g00003 [Ridgeia piscesae]|uniref:Uncharacterized protein n=1 Tax=Ridgeia piscesae TaxID=27915 RepID=A0AAD9MN21_RIDPI|nr:hypothetical protein NP493_7739g00003 [Ridgeia piscesae]
MFSYTRLGWGERERLKGNQLRNGHASVNSVSVNLLYLHFQLVISKCVDRRYLCVRARVCVLVISAHTCSHVIFERLPLDRQWRTRNQWSGTEWKGQSTCAENIRDRLVYICI